MTSTPRRPRAAIAALAVAALTLSGCMYAQIPEESASPVVPTEDPGATTSEVPGEGFATLEEYYAQELDWEECGSEHECTTVVAPLDWEDPAAASIQLAVVRAPATGGDAIGSLLTNPGGPGASGKSFILDSVDFAVKPAVREVYDVIGFDPRGVGESTAVTCLDTDEMMSYLYDIPEAERNSPEWEDELAARHRSFAEACEANSGGILEFVTTVNSARDMDLLRGVLDSEKLDYLGYSYGTFLGATYAELYPENVGRMVLDGAIDPSTSGVEVGVTQAVGFENALRAYMQWCLDGTDCPFSGTVDQGMNDLAILLEEVDAEPIAAPDGRLLGADTLLTGIIAALYAEESWVFLSLALSGVYEGDATIVFLLADFYNSAENGEFTDNQTEAFRAYNCMDYPDDLSEADEEAMTAQIAAEAPTIAPYWGSVDSCADWAYPPSGTRGEIHAEGTPEILVVGTTGDPATPYAWSVALAEQLAGGVLLTNVGEGHTAYSGTNRCVTDAIDAFLVEGVVPAENLCD